MRYINGSIPGLMINKTLVEYEFEEGLPVKLWVEVTVKGDISAKEWGAFTVKWSDRFGYKTPSYYFGRTPGLSTIASVIQKKFHEYSECRVKHYYNRHFQILGHGNEEETPST